MARPGAWLREHPKKLIDDACAEFGVDVIRAWCIELATGRCPAHDEQWPPISNLGGKTTWPDYWARVWGTRGLLYCWDPADDSAVDAVLAALSDDHWRVREMAAKVTYRHEVGVAAEPVAGLVDDKTSRVAVAAARALGVIGEGEHAEILATVVDVGPPSVSSAASAALEKLRVRLDRPL